MRPQPALAHLQKLGLSVRNVAALARETPGNAADYLAGRRVPSRRFAAAVADILGLPVASCFRIGPDGRLSP